MKSLKERLEEKIEKDATLRSLRQCSTGQDDLNKAISWYIKIGFEDGAASLVPLVIELHSALVSVVGCEADLFGEDVKKALQSIEKFLEWK